MKDSLKQFAIHREPAWRDRADFIFNAQVVDSGEPERFEQLWGRQLVDGGLELCCIPFFVYDLALGDIVALTTKGERPYVFDRVVEQSGHYTFRIWLGGASGTSDDTRDELLGLGVMIEHSSRNLMAVDATGAEMAEIVKTYLEQRQGDGRLVFETGWTA